MLKHRFFNKLLERNGLTVLYLLIRPQMAFDLATPPGVRYLDQVPGAGTRQCSKTLT
jgi:hypothetical protein